MKKVLHFISGLHMGGAETYIKSELSSLENNSKYIPYFILQDNNISNQYFKELYKNKPNQFHFITSFYSNPFKHYLELKSFLISNQIDFIHIHVNSFINPLPLILSNKLKIPIVLHSHNTLNANGGKIGTLIHNINKTFFNQVDFPVACGRKAGKWMFGNKNFEIIPNSIDIEKFRFSQDKRENIRTQLNVSLDSKVIGIVGRLHPQKNHKKAIDIFDNYYEKDSNSYLMIVGDGDLKQDLLNYARSKKSYKNIIFCGNINDTSPYYSAFDCLLLPSLFEGLGIVGLEAQASGLPVICSTNVPKEIQLLDSIKFVSLEENDKFWSEVLSESFLTSNFEIRQKAFDIMKKTIYTMENLKIKLIKLYQL